MKIFPFHSSWRVEKPKSSLYTASESVAFPFVRREGANNLQSNISEVVINWRLFCDTV
jgi:hypothetical protein